MSHGVTLSRTTDDLLVATKRAAPGPGADRLRHEARVLDLARHPGVVELLALVEHDDGSVELRTAVAGPTPLSLAGTLPLAQVAALGVALASTVAELHRLGVVHGRIEGAHVLLGPGGRPVLCGFGSARLSPAGPHADLVPADDVAGVGRTLRALVQPDTEPEPIPERRRPRAARRRRPWTGYQQRALLTLVDQATAPDPDHRPSARNLAASLAAAFPEAVLEPVDPAPDAGPVVPTTGSSHPDHTEADHTRAEHPGPDHPGPDHPEAGDPEADDPGPDPAPPLVTPVADEHRPASSPAPARAWVAVLTTGRARLSAAVEGARTRLTGARPAAVGLLAAVVGVVGLASVAAGVGALRGGARPELSTGAPPTSTTGGAPADTPSTAGDGAAAPAPAPASPGATTVAPAPPDPDCHEPEGAVADLDGDGCRGAVVVAGRVARTEVGPFEVGVEHDKVVVGDWDCDGEATVALLRPSSGAVFVFSGWGADGAGSEVAPTTHVPGATALEVHRDGSCDEAVATDPTGAERPVDLRSADR